MSPSTPSSSSSPSAVVSTALDGLTLVSKGKVRDIYALPSAPDRLLFVATDRISAYDVVLRNGIPSKGALLTEISSFWFNRLASIIPHHVIATKIEDMPAEVQPHASVLRGRTMLVKKAKVIPLEAIVRGYVTGSAWSEYRTSGTVHGIPLPVGLVESEKLPQPLFTPSTKAEQGEHDENISPARAAEIIGPALCARIEKVALELYASAAAYALERGLILADTKFEFGLLPSANTSPESDDDGELILIDEALTPDSSRYWPLQGYAPGGPQPSFDKQYLRDWLVSAGFRKGLEGGPEGKEGEGWMIDEEVVKGTRKRYVEARDMLLKD